jgi:hypothetical protein
MGRPMQPSQVWNALQCAARRFVDDLDKKSEAINPKRVADAVIAAHEQLPDADVYRELLEREVREYVARRKPIWK